MRSALGMLVFLFCAPVLRAQGLVQLTFTGEIDARGGARVEADVTFADTHAASGQRTVSLALLLGERTGSSDLAVLLARRLEQAGAHVIFTGATAPARGPVNVFVEDVLAVGLKLGSGLSAVVTLCEDRPASVKLLPGTESKLGASFAVVAHTFEPHTKEHGKLAFELTFPERSEVPDVGLKLVKAAIEKGWPSEMEGHDTWRPGGQTETALVTACSFELHSNADWRFDLLLGPRTAPR